VFVHARTANAVRDAVDAFTHLRVSAEPGSDNKPSVTVHIGNATLALDVHFASAPTAAALKERVQTHTAPNTVPFIVADRLSRAARSVLRDAGWGWWDRRGHLHLVEPTAGVVIDTDVEQERRGVGPTEPLATSVGREVAVALLLQPSSKTGVRELAARLERSPSAVSVALRELRAESLVDGENRPRAEALFDAVAHHWKPRVALLRSRPEPHEVAAVPRLRAGIEDLSTEGWALTGPLAAIKWGAPVAASADLPPDLYVPDRAVLDRALEKFGRADTQPAARLLLAPVPQAVRPRFEPQRSMFGDPGWPMTHPLFVALELARDRARGAEVLASFTPEGFTRVW